MKVKIKLILVLTIVIGLLGTFFVSNLNAASSIHEAENDTNKLKYASISGDYVVFDEKKDAYVEMKSVNSPEAGTMTLTFYYVASNSFPLELKVNGNTISSNDTISSTSSGTVSYEAKMSSGTGNVIRFKIRDAVSGVKLDKVIISDAKSSSDTTPGTVEATNDTTDTTTNTTTAQPTNEDPGNVDTSNLIGFASLNGGTTGGNGGSSVTVSNGSDLQNAIKNKGSSPLTIYVDGTITQSNSDDSTISVKEVDDVSIIGKGTNGEFDGIGIKVWKANNIIIRNLEIHHVSEGNKDCIGIEGPSSNVWVDHCELYNDLDHDKDYYDGLLDAKSDSEYITFSWNYLHDSYKTSLVGSSDSDTYDRKITYHHNKIEDCNSRLPSYRGGTGHIYNNYYLNNLESAINCRQGCKLRIEGNYFSNIINPIVYLYSDSTGYWDVKDNIFDNCSDSQPTKSTTSFSPPYSYDLDPASSVPSIVNSNAGIGKIN